MRKFICVLLSGLMLISLVGCDAEGAEIAGNLYDALKDAGEYVAGEVDSAVDEFQQQGTTNNTEDFYTEEDYDYDVNKLFKEKVFNMSRQYAADGNEVLGLMSGIKESGLTLLIERANFSEAYVVGKAITCDGTPYIEGINELEGSYYDFCGLNGIIRKSISDMIARKFTVYQYDKYVLDVSLFEDLDDTNQFDVLTLVNEKGSICGFYFYER